MVNAASVEIIRHYRALGFSGGELTDKLRRHVRLLGVLDAGYARDLEDARPSIGRAYATQAREWAAYKARMADADYRAAALARRRARHRAKVAEGAAPAQGPSPSLRPGARR